MPNETWTHTATLARAYKIGPQQDPTAIAPAAARVELYQDPAEQEGETISIRYGHWTGVVQLADLRGVAVA